MKVKDVVLLAADMLGLKERVDAYLNHGDEDGERDTNLLLRSYNTVESELALDYLPLHCEDVVQTDTGRITYGTLSMPPVRLLRVTDEDGKSVAFKIFPDYFQVETLGEVRVSYTYAPMKKSVGDDGEYKVQASERLIAYGMAAEYCLWKGLFEEASAWEKKYKDALKKAYEAKPSKIMRSRRWA